MPSNIKKAAPIKSAQSLIKSPAKTPVKLPLKAATKSTINSTGPAPSKTSSPTLKPTKSPKDPALPKPAKAMDPTNAVSNTPSKQAVIIALLRRSDGSNLSELMQATGWQAHSVRGFLSGTIKKKLGLNLISQKQDGVQHYRFNAAN